ncbi:MAG: enoyl-CoA hydratase [Candidatus Eisenbacteria bacterium]|uniref:Enoyl-CoA hydratase n=1 Tax=Eiseniibacteriota bacterium TaxID=2212470 RepID=A0A849SM58_UNCEI|nr:enoyl-CoA hydratase [Candidatus Eisenbacteria bacterium]
MSTPRDAAPTGDVPLRVIREGPVLRLTLARPPLNVLSRSLNRAIAAQVKAAAEDPGAIAIVIDGGDSRGFSAGVEVADHVPETIDPMLADFHAAIRALWAFDGVSLALIHGVALGGGLELALACDLVIATEDARLGLPEIALGCYPPVAAAVLPSRIGWATACELVLGGEPIPASRALALGLVNRVCAPAGLREAGDALLAPILTRSRAALREAKRALRDGAPDAEGSLARIERRYTSELMRLSDAGEGVAAFMEKRPPRWRHD